MILGEFVLNPRNRTLTKSGRFIDLTQVEFQIMECFFQNPGAALDPDGYPEPCLGQLVFWRGKNRRCQYPPPAHED